MKFKLLQAYSPTVPLLEGQSWFLVQNFLLSRFFFTLSHFFYCIVVHYFASQLENFGYCHWILKNVLLLDQKSRFFRDFVPLFVSDRLVSMYMQANNTSGYQRGTQTLNLRQRKLLSSIRKSSPHIRLHWAIIHIPIPITPKLTLTDGSLTTSLMTKMWLILMGNRVGEREGVE